MSTYEHTYAGVESVQSATLQSDNTVYARISLDVGPQNIVDMARLLGVRSSPLEAVPSIALGSIGVTPIEMASVYSTLAAGGVYSKPMAITKVVLPNGKTDTDVGWGKPQRERVIPDWVASTVTQVLEQNMLQGTGTGAHLSGRTDAGKTGTTDNYADAWFSGYTPRLEATVWIGYPSGEIPMLDVHGIAVSGPTFPASIWHLYMETAVGKGPDVPFPPPLTEPLWAQWHGQYEYSGSYGTSHRDDDGDDVDADDADGHGRNDDPPAHDAAAGDDDADRSAGDDDGSAGDADNADADGNRAAAVDVSDLLTFEEAQAKVLARVRTLAAETVPIDARRRARDGGGRPRGRRSSAVPELRHGRLRGPRRRRAGDVARGGEDRRRPSGHASPRRGRGDGDLDRRRRPRRSGCRRPHRVCCPT